jgi:hypothetical protein
MEPLMAIPSSELDEQALEKEQAFKRRIMGTTRLALLVLCLIGCLAGIGLYVLSG